MLEQLVAALEQKRPDLTAEEMADVLWLTVQMWKSASDEVTQVDPVASKALPRPAKADRAVESSLPESEPAKVTPPERSKSQAQTAAGVTTQQSTEADSSTLGSPLAIPDSTALRRSLALLKAIRPLIRLVPSANRTYLDVPATVKVIAQTELWLLKLRPVPEPWLELALVIDVTPSMVIWQRTVLKLRQVLAQSGVFRDVRLWSLELADGTDKVASVPTREGERPQHFQRLCLRSGFGVATAPQVACRAQELLDPSGRRLILVVSDCIAPRWDEQPVRDMLQMWAVKGPMGLVQVLPEWLWSRTALDGVPKGQLVAQSAGQPSQSLRFLSRRDRWRRQATVGIKIPVLTLEPAVAGRWSCMVAGQSAVSSPGLVFSEVMVRSLLPVIESAAEDVQGQAGISAQDPEPTAQERMAQFRDFSSPMARRLAGLLAACPEVNLPVIRMVQEALLPASQQVHVAEVLLGGLFKPQIELSLQAPADQVQYVFHEGVRSLVQHTIPPDEAFEALTRWLSRRFGYSLSDFQGYITTTEGSEAVKPFAGVLLDVLKRRRRDYAELIQQVEQVYRPGSAFPELEPFEFINAQLVESVTFPPPLQTEEFTVVTFEASNEPELFEFTMATLERRSRLLRRDLWEIQRQRQRAYRLIETLPDDSLLEVVAIPAGTFTMGSLEAEPERYDDESPMHEVAVAPFFMGRYPVTQAQWRAVASLPQIERSLEAAPSLFKGNLRPVEQVSWYDAMEFCARLSAHTGCEYRLPTEAEWEYACRAGTTMPFHFGDMITTEVANYNGSAYAGGPKGRGRGKTTPVDQFGCANAFGLSDMHGNVWEWCADHWHDNYKGAPTDGSVWLTDDKKAKRVLRGGAWNDYPRNCRSAFRDNDSPGFRLPYVGFRVSCSAPRTQ